MRVSQRRPSSRRRANEFRRKTWGNVFGGLLREARLERGRSVEEAARAAGMEASEWEVVEAGQVPDWNKACHMAGALGVDRMGIAFLVLFCHEAWD